MTNNLPKRISRAWLQGRKTFLQATARTLPGGDANPNYVEAEAEIAQAAAELERWQAFEGWVRSSLGMALNAYPIRTKGQVYEPGQVFFKKDKATNAISFLTVQAAWERYEQAHQN